MRFITAVREREQVNLKHSKACPAQGTPTDILRSRCVSSTFAQPSAHSPACLALEPRTLLAAVAWTGAAGDSLWSTPENWSGNTLPVNGDDVTIADAAANPTIRFTRGDLRLASLTLRESLTISGGALRLSGDARILAPLNVMGGTIGGPTFEGGRSTWDCAAAHISFTGSAISRIEGNIHFFGTLNVTSARVKVDAQLSIAGVANITNGAIDLEQENSQVVSGTFVLINSRIGLAARPGELPGVAKSLTIAPAVTVRGWGTVGGATFTERVTTDLKNYGTIIADARGQFLIVAPIGAFSPAMSNFGLIRATNGAAVRIAATNLSNYSDAGGGTLTGGTWRADANSSLAIDYNRAIAINAATIILGGTNATIPNLMEQLQTNNGILTLGNGHIWTRYYPVSNNGTITLESISNLNLPVGGTHAGTFNIGAGSVLTVNAGANLLPSARFLGAGQVTISSGTMLLKDWFGESSNVKLSIGRNASVTLAQSLRLGSIEVLGTLNLEMHHATLSGTFSQPSTGRLLIDVRDTSSIGSITVAGGVSLDGTLNITSSTGFDPSENQVALFTAVFFTAAGIDGAFATTNIMGVAAGAYKFVNTGATFELWHNVADFNGDGGVDGSDFEAFATAWVHGINTADVSGDGGVDGADIEYFTRIWGEGGR